MKRALVITIVFCVSVLCSLSKLQAQTYYYKLDRIVRNGVSSTNTSGGQFITFNSRCCYESDKAGYSVGNGRLDYKYVENGLKVYYGESYLGSNSTCLVTQDLNTVNLKAENVVYVYKRSTPPSGVTTCSLIRKNTPSYSSSEENVGGDYTVMPSQPVYNGGGGTSTTTIITTPERKTPTKVWHECSLCHGKRTIVHESFVSTYGHDTQWYCSQCGSNVWRSSGHSHVTCTQCGGQGGYYTTQYR